MMILPSKYKDSILFSIILFMAAAIPIAFFPDIRSSFFWPKLLILMTGTSLLVCIGGKVEFQKILVVLIGLNLISLFYTANPYYTKIAAVLNISCLLIYYYTSKIVTLEKAKILIAVIGFTGVLVSIVTYFRFYGYPLFIPLPEKAGMIAIGTLGNTNFLGCYLLFPLIALIYIFHVTDKVWAKAGLFTCLLFVYGALVMTEARAAWISFAVGGAVFIGLNKDRIPGIKEFVVALVVGMVFVTFLIFNSVVPNKPTSFHDSQVKKWTDSKARVKSMNFRLKFWQAGAYLIKQKPVLGSGLWSFRKEVYEAQAALEKETPGYMDYSCPKPRHVHNDYLEILIDGGIVGAACLLVFFFLVVKDGFTLLSRGKRDQQIIITACFACIASIMVSALLFFPFHLIPTLFNFALMLGIIRGIRHV